MTIQSLPVFFDMIYTKEDGRLSPDGYLYNDQTFQTLNYSVSTINQTISTYIQQSTENPFGLTPVPQPKTVLILGINPPSYTTAQIASILISPSSSIPIGTIWYNSDLDKLQFLGTSSVQTITST